MQRGPRPVAEMKQPRRRPCCGSGTKGRASGRRAEPLMPGRARRARARVSWAKSRRERGLFQP
eukprot:917389-Pyramimonas_sp.AAC.1